MRNFQVPHCAHIALTSGWPFFMVTGSMSLDTVLALHFTRQIRIDSDGVVVGGSS